MIERRLGKYLSLAEFCTCTQTYQRFADQIDPFPKKLDETLPALEALCRHIVDPVIEGFGRDSPYAEADALRTEKLRQRFQLTYGFCSVDLKRWLAKKDPLTGKKHGIATPSLDQHIVQQAPLLLLLAELGEFGIAEIVGRKGLVFLVEQGQVVRVVVAVANVEILKGDRQWLEAIVMVIADKPVEFWKDEDVTSLYCRYLLRKLRELP